jgi:hypothetical protein
MANYLISQGLIDYNCERNEIDEKFEKDSPEEFWYLNSYLQRDIERFNAQQVLNNPLPGEDRGEADLFLIKGCELISVNRFAHVVSLPGREEGDWHGDLFLSHQDIGGSVSSTNVRFSLKKPTKAPTPEDVTEVPIDGGGFGGKRRGTPSVPQVHAATVGKFFFRPNRSSEAADIYLVGNDGVIKDRRDEQLISRYPLRLMGSEIPLGQSARLKDGDWIQFAVRRGDTEPQRHTFIYSSSDIARTLSGSRRRNGREQRFTVPNTLGFVSAFVSGMNDLTRAAVHVEEASSLRGLDVELTVDKLLHDQMTDKLRGFVENRNRAESRRSRPIRASATMIDVFSGNVLALPSFPSNSQDLRRFRYLSTRQRRRLLQNQNFVRHPIGSAAKPFWLSAVLSEFPFLAGFKVPGHGEQPDHPTVLGHELQPRGYGTLGHPSEVNVHDFLRLSCNKYLVDLVTFAIAVKPGSVSACRGLPAIPDIDDCFELEELDLDSGDQFQVGTSRVRKRPVLAGHGLDGKLIGLDQDTVFRRFRNITNTRVFSGGPTLAPDVQREDDVDRLERSWELWRSASRYYVQPWESLITHLRDEGADEDLTFARLGSVSPEAVNLAIDKVDALRGEWTSLLLGGGSSLWNNVQAAEALARLVTGLDVKVNLISSLKMEDDREIDLSPQRNSSAGSLLLADAPDSLERDARRLVLSGMEQTLAVGGTARRLEGLRNSLDSAFPEHDVRVFAKTGTPAVELQILRPLAKVIRELYNRRGVDYVPENQEVRITSEGDRYLDDVDPELRNGARDLVADMNANINAFRVYPGEEPRALLMLRGERLDINEAAPGSYEQTKSSGAVLVLSVLVIPQQSGSGVPLQKVSGIGDAVRREAESIPEASSRDLRAAAGVALAIYFEDLGGGSELAVEFANDLGSEIRDALRRQLEAREDLTR